MIIGRGITRVQAAPSDLGGFEQLFRERWWPMVRLAAGFVESRSEAEDIVQDAFGAIYRRRGALRDPSAASAYLYTCVVNGSRAALRRRKRLRAVMETYQPDDTIAEPDANRIVIAQLLRTLPHRQRTVLLLRYLLDLSDLEIAEITGLSQGGVRSAVSRALASLRKESERDG